MLIKRGATTGDEVAAVRLGAWGCLPKPLDLQRLTDALDRAWREAQGRRSLLAARDDIARRLAFRGMLGCSAPMQELFTQLRRLAPRAGTILLVGEPGTGKRLAARAMHLESPRCTQPFVAVKCSAVVGAVLDDEPGSGPPDAARGRTVFLNEIAELSLTAQRDLLRRLEPNRQRPAVGVPGGAVGLYASTSRDLFAEVAAGRFRADLFQHLSSTKVHLPALRNRREDILYLTASFVRECADRLRKALHGITPAAEHILQSADWPGNVRQLRHVVEHACALARGRLLTEWELRGFVGEGLADKLLHSRSTKAAPDHADSQGPADRATH